MAKDPEPGDAKMLRGRFVLIGGVLTGGFLTVVLLATSASAGMQRDLSNCTAAKDRAGAAACTRVMDSGRLPDAQMYIGFFNRGTALSRAGAYDRAIVDFSRALERRSQFARAFEARGLAYAAQGAVSKAIADLDASVMREPKEWRFLFSRASVLRADGQREAALADLDAARSLKSHEPKIALMRALLLADGGDYRGANDEVDSVSSAGGDDAAARYVRAAIAFAEGRGQDAAVLVDRALELRADFSAAQTLKGRILEARGEAAAARKHFEQALAAGGGSFDAPAARRTARERLDALGKDAGKRGAEVAAAPAGTARQLDCKVFLPATGSVITATCSE